MSGQTDYIAGPISEGWLGVLKDGVASYQTPEGDAHAHLLENSKDVLWTRAETGECTAISSAVQRILGYSKAEITDGRPDSWDNRIHPDDTKRARSAFSDLVAQQGSFDLEYRILRADGTWVWVRDRALATFTQQGRLHIQGIFTDISKRIDAVETLRSSQERFSAAFRLSPNPVTISDVETGEFVDVNQSFLSIAGYTAEQVVGKTSKELGLWRDRRERTRFVDTIKSGEPAINMVTEMVVAGGKELIGLLSGDIITLSGRQYLLAIFNDITERQRTADAEKESRQMLQLLLDTIPARVFWKDLNSTYLGCNALFAQDAGLPTPGHVVGKTDFDLPWCAKEADSYRADDHEVMETGKPKIRFEETQTGPDGQTIWLVTSKVPLDDASGNRVGILGTYEEVTEKRATLEALRQSEKSFKRLSEATFETVIIHDNSSIMEVNQSALGMFGYEPEELVGTNPWNLAAPESRLLVRKRIDSGTQGPHEAICLHKSGKRFYAELNARRITYDGRILQVTTVRDISTRKKAERDLRESEANFRALTENSTDGIIIAASVSELLYANQHASELTGFKNEELLKLTIEDLSHPDEADRISRHFERRMKGEPIVRQVETALKNRSGDKVSVEMTISVTTWHGKRAALIILRDITSRIDSQQKRLELEAQLRESQKMEAMGTLASGVAHDFNNMITVMGGNATRLRKLVGQKKEAQEAIEMIETAVEQAASLTKSLLTFARKMPTEKQVVDLREVFESSAKLTAQTLPKNINLEIKPLPDSPILSKVSDSQISQALVNLGINARDAMPNGGTLTMSIRPDEAGKNCARVEISDTGTGMDEEVSSRIFEPFFTTKRRGRGTGLGLAITRGIIEDHGGNIRVRSKPQQGSTFSVYIPSGWSIRGQEDENKDSPAQPSAPKNTSNLVLMVDDDDALRTMAKKFLETSGYTVIEASSGKELMELFAQHRDEVASIICDINIPEPDGLECLKLIRESGSQIPVILISGAAPGPAPSIPKDVTLIPKPFRMRDLLMKMEAKISRS